MITYGPVYVQYIGFEELVRLEGLGINAIKFKVPTETSSRKKYITKHFEGFVSDTVDYESRQRSQQRTLQEQKALMMQSPWTTDNSPPMDLDYDEEYTQRGVFLTKNFFQKQTCQLI